MIFLFQKVPGFTMEAGAADDKHYFIDQNISMENYDIVVIGAGSGGLVAATTANRKGLKVALLEKNKDEAREIIVDIFLKEGIQIIYNAELKEIRNSKAEKIITYMQHNVENEISAESIFLAIGRQPNVAGLDLEKAGITFSENGIKTNSFLQTSVPQIYSCGDVTSLQKFTHTASYQAGVAEANRFVTDKSATGFLKVIFDAENLVTGADAIGAHAGEWIQLLTIAIKNKIPAGSCADTIFAYPAYSEIVKRHSPGIYIQSNDEYNYTSYSKEYY